MGFRHRRNDRHNRYKAYCARSRPSVSRFTASEMASLHRKAVEHAGTSDTAQCKWICRNMKPEYFTDINSKHGGIMKVRMKDPGGDPKSPINCKLSGIFFFAGEPASSSPFGSTQLQVPAEILFGMADNLYFADFFCLQGRPHYVTLVMTKQDSEADRFCRDNLVKLDMSANSDNPFLFRDSALQLRVNTRSNLYIEVFFTENLNLENLKTNGSEIKEGIPTYGNGEATGLPKNPECGTCNLQLI